jgi:RNA polymerase sigma-70 factor, ECF subfamily
MDRPAERLARGDQAAFAELYDSCADRVHRYLVALTGSRADADDVLQETFVRLARMTKSLAAVDNLVAYVFATARNEAIRLAQRQVREDHVRAGAELVARFCEVPVEDPEALETAEWVAAALARLSDELREIVELKIYAELTFREISEVTGLPQGTVATRYRSALEKMRNQMVKEQQ